MYCRIVRVFAIATQKLKSHPTKLDDMQIDFIIEMVQSELVELKNAKNLVDQIDAFIDIIYYVCHSALKHGINLDKYFQVVHDANMRKLVDGKAIKDRSGKVIKPEGWYGPEREIQYIVDEETNAVQYRASDQ